MTNETLDTEAQQGQELTDDTVWTTGENGERIPNYEATFPEIVEGQVVTNWKQALEQLALAYPDRINPHL